MKEFAEKIKKFNEMYGVESNDVPTNLGQDRLKKFKAILLEEIEEADEIDLSTDEGLVDVADLYLDIVVYCASECRRWGIPIEQVLNIIMESNFSKLGEDGLPIKDERGKILKGKAYWKPEPKIKELLNNLHSKSLKEHND